MKLIGLDLLAHILEGSLRTTSASKGRWGSLGGTRLDVVGAEFSVGCSVGYIATLVVPSEGLSNKVQQPMGRNRG